MRARKQINVLLDLELAAQVEQRAREAGLSASAVMRDALRAQFGVAEPYDRGWREGFAAAYSHVRGHFERAMATMEPIAPTEASRSTASSTGGNAVFPPTAPGRPTR